MCRRKRHWKPAFRHPLSACVPVVGSTRSLSPLRFLLLGGIVPRVSTLRPDHVRIWPPKDGRYGSGRQGNQENQGHPASSPARGRWRIFSNAVSEPGRVLAADRWLARKFLTALGSPAAGDRILGRREIRTCADRPVARAMVRDRGALYRMLTNPVLHFGDLYSVKRIDIEGDLLQFLEATHIARSTIAPSTAGQEAAKQRAPTGRAPTHSRTPARQHPAPLRPRQRNFMNCGRHRGHAAHLRVFPRPRHDRSNRPRSPSSTTYAASSSSSRATVVEAGCGGALAPTWRSSASRCVPSISHTNKFVRARQAESTGAGGSRNTSRTTIAIFQANTTRSFQSACLEHVGPSHYRALADD